MQAQKFGQLEEQMSDYELGENSVLLESPLDKLEPYQIFRSCLLRKLQTCLRKDQHLIDSKGLQQEQPQFYTSLSSHLSADEQAVIRNVVALAEANEMANRLQSLQAQVAQIEAAANGNHTS